jgi:hypothetical protein
MITKLGMESLVDGNLYPPAQKILKVEDEPRRKPRTCRRLDIKEQLSRMRRVPAGMRALWVAVIG